MSKKILHLADVLKSGESIMNMMTFQGQIFVLTTRNIYVVKGNKISPLKLITEKKEDASSEV